METLKLERYSHVLTLSTEAQAGLPEISDRVGSVKSCEWRQPCLECTRSRAQLPVGLSSIWRLVPNLPRTFTGTWVVPCERPFGTPYRKRYVYVHKKGKPC
jgi:hypothetical protein